MNPYGVMMKNNHCIVRPTSQEERKKLIHFLDEQGFTYTQGTSKQTNLVSVYPMIIDILPKTVHHCQTAMTAACAVSTGCITEKEFYERYEEEENR